MFRTSQGGAMGRVIKSPSFRQGDDVALEAVGFAFLVFVLVDLMKVAAHAQEDAPGAGGD